MIGIDIVRLSRFERVLSETPSIVDVILHQEEKRISIRPEFIAGRFAAKEALLKSGVGIKDFSDFSEIEITLNDDGILQTKWRSKIINVALSITHDCDYAAAVALNGQVCVYVDNSSERDPRYA